MEYQHILTEIRDNVALIRFDRPKLRNRLCRDLIAELQVALDAYEADDTLDEKIPRRERRRRGGHRVRFADGMDRLLTDSSPLSIQGQKVFS